MATIPSGSHPSNIFNYKNIYCMTNIHNITEIVQEYLDSIYFEGYSETLSSEAFDFEIEQFSKNHLN